MKTFYKWTKEEFGLDIMAMDREHQILIDKMNVLYNSVETKETYEKTLSAFVDLVQNSMAHFKSEEEYMKRIEYYDLRSHKIVHQDLLAQLTVYADEFKNKKSVHPDLFVFLKYWLTSHMQGADMKYADKKSKKIS